MKNLLVLISALAILACSSGKKQLEKGNYEAAMSQAMKRLRNSPDNKKARSTLRQAYPLASEIYLDKINQLKKTNERFKWDQIASSYNYLNSIYKQISRCPACMDVLPRVRNYLSEYNKAAVLAAKERYAAGEEELDKGTREAAREAYYHFERADAFVPNYKDTPKKLEESRYLATLHVMLDQIPVHSRSLGLSHEFFQNQLYEAVDERVNDFVRFYSPQEANRTGLRDPDHIIVLQFDDFVVGQMYMRESSTNVSRDSVVVGSTEVEGETYDVYGTVEAELIVYEKHIDSGGLLDMRIYDGQTDRILLQRKMPGEFNWVAEWATYKGDKRALTDEEYELTRYNEPPSPSPQFLFEQFCNPIYSQALGHIRSFYRNY